MRAVSGTWTHAHVEEIEKILIASGLQINNFSNGISFEHFFFHSSSSEKSCFSAVQTLLTLNELFVLYFCFYFHKERGKRLDG